MAWRRRRCHLCQVPKPPWAVLGDFSRAVCRACVNAEGVSRVEPLLATAAGHRATGATALSPSVPTELSCVTPESAESRLALSPSVPTELGEGLGTESHLRGHHRDISATNTGLALSSSVPTELREALCSRVTLEGTDRRSDATLAVSPSVPTEPSDALHGRIALEITERRHRRDVTLPLDVSPSVPAGLGEALCSRVTFEGTERRCHDVPMDLSCHRATLAVSPAVPEALSRHRATLAVSPTVPTELRHHRATTLAVSPAVPTELRHHRATLAVSPAVPEALSRHRATLAVSPAVPEALRRHRATPAVSPAVPAVPAALAAAWPGKPRAVRERLSLPAGCAPFAVRFRRDHGLVGRVLAFDAAPGGRRGAFELRLFAEYPCGSGSVYGAPGLARRMLRDCGRAAGGSISSGYEHLEYEKRRGSGEWRLLAELFTEPVRFFRRPPAPEALPQQQRCHPLSPPRRRRKRRPEEAAGAALSRGRCRRPLEDARFVQCPAVPRHRFCFPCARRAIRARGPGRAVHCPGGGRCPLAGSGLPWAFLQAEIAAILAGEDRVKPERQP